MRSLTPSYLNWSFVSHLPRGYKPTRRWISLPPSSNRNSFVTNYALSPLGHRTFLVCTQRRNMSRDVTKQVSICSSALELSPHLLSQANIAVSKMDADGSFNRRPSSFRDTIQKGGQHEPEPGTPDIVSKDRRGKLTHSREISPLCFVCMPVGPQNAYYKSSKRARGHHWSYSCFPSYGRTWLAVCRC